MPAPARRPPIPHTSASCTWPFPPKIVACFLTNRVASFVCGSVRVSQREWFSRPLRGLSVFQSTPLCLHVARHFPPTRRAEYPQDHPHTIICIKFAPVVSRLLDARC